MTLTGLGFRSRRRSGGFFFADKAGFLNRSSRPQLWRTTLLHHMPYLNLDVSNDGAYGNYRIDDAEQLWPAVQATHQDSA